MPSPRGGILTTMSNELMDPNAASLRRPTLWMERLLMLAFLVCLLVGIAALAAFLTLRAEQRPSLTVDPLAAARSEFILPQLALRELAGDSAAGLAAQAIQAGQLETARVILTFAADIPPLERASRLNQLGELYLRADQSARAGQVFRLIVPAAILADSVPPLERAQRLAQAAQGLLDGGYERAAAEIVVQALRIGTQTPQLLPAQRSQIFNELRPIAAGINDRALIAQVTDLARNPYLTGAGVMITPTLTTLGVPVPYDSATQSAIEARQQAALLLAERINLTGGVDIDPEKASLVQALLAEDEARTRFYQSVQEISLQQQLWLLLDQRSWLAVKARIAMGGYGMSLIPAWEEQIDAIRNELNASHSFLNTVFDALAAAQATPLEQAMLRVEAQHWMAEQAERGLYPNAPVQDIGQRLRVTQDDLARLVEPVALPIAYEEQAALPGYRIQPVP